MTPKEALTAPLSPIIPTAPSARLQNRTCGETIEADKDIDHAAIPKDKIVIYGIQLTIKSHLLTARRTRGPISLLKKTRFASKLVTSSDLWGGPPEL